MPVADFTPQFKRAADNDFDRLKLKLNEKARIVLLEKPTYGWVHTLRAPKIVSGQAVKVERKRGGETIMDYDLDFIGRPLCLGDDDTLHNDAVDPKNCPICKRAKESDEVSPPERRFAVNVIRYSLKRDGATIADPFGCQALVWSFPESTYNKLYGIAQEYTSQGGIIGRDLILGPCQSPEAYQKFDIMAGSEAVWKIEAYQDTVVKTFQNNKVENLETACGRKTERRWMEADLDKIADRWRVARGSQDADTGDTGTGEQATLTAGLSDLLNTGSTTSSGYPGANVVFSANPSAEVPEAAVADKPKEQEKTGDTKPDAPATDLKSLLASLNLPK